MNGWLRLWVLVSVVWAVVVVSVAAIIIPEKLEAFDPTTARPADSGSKYGGNPFDQFDEEEPNPFAQFDITLPNGRVIKGVFEGTSKEEIKDKAIRNGLATAADFDGPWGGVPVDPLDELIMLKEKENQHERQEVIRTSIMVSIIPPLMLLLLGYGFAWVLRGFGSNR